MNPPTQKSLFHRQAAVLLALAACLLALPFLALAQPAAAEVSFCQSKGSGAGQCKNPQGVAVDTETGLVYVADQGNNRIDVFGADGSFVEAFGWDVVSSGPDHVAAPSEQQQITLGANTIGGTFAIRFGQNSDSQGYFTEPIASDAPASGPSSVQSALNALPSIGGQAASVSVAGPNGGPYVVTFGGSLSGDDVEEMATSVFGLVVSSGEKTATVKTLVPGGAFEICKASAGDLCKAGTPGPGAGQFSRPSRIAVDNVAGSSSRHDIYVGSGNFRVEKLEANGNFVSAFGWGVDIGAAKLESCTTGSGCQAGIAGAGECQLSKQDDPIAVGPSGNVFVADGSGSEPNFTNRVEKFSPAGACLGETLLIKGNHRLVALAVDSSEDVYVSDERANGLYKYSLSAPETQVCALDPDVSANALSLGETGNLFAFHAEGRDGKGGSFQVIAEYNSSCEIVRRFGYGKIHSNLVGLAAYHSPEGDLFGSESNSGIVRYLTIPPAGPLVAPESVEANLIGNTKATIRAEINPEGKASAYHFEYLTQKAFEEQGGYAGPATKSTAVTPLSIPAGKEFRLRSAEAAIGCPVATQQLIDEGKCLEPESEYRFRVIATNADNPTGVGEGTVEGSFITEPSIEIGDVYATEVGTEAATLNARVNPFGIPATAYFEYVDEATYQESGFAQAIRIPNTEAGEEPIDFGSAETFTARSASLYPLAPGTAYRYRLVATNPFLAEPLPSGERSFTTLRPSPPEPCPANEAFRAGVSALLPDCRAYELVSPLDKENGDIKVNLQFLTGLPAVLTQSSVSGEKLVYGAQRSFGDSPSALFTSQYIAARRADGWSSHGISPPATFTITGSLEPDYEFRAFSPDLCEGWIIPLSEPPLAEGAIPGFYNLYHRRDQLCGGESYEALTTSQPEYTGGEKYLELQGLSADGSVAAFAAVRSLQGSGAPAGTENKRRLYATSPGQPPRFLCILPGGEASKAPCTAGWDNTGSSSGFPYSRSANLTNAVSADGRRIFWTANAAGEKIYLRENPFGEGVECEGPDSPCTIAVSKEAEEESGTSPSHYWTAAADGSLAIFSTGGSLYEFEVGTETTKEIAQGLMGVMGASEDASRVYFASSEALAPGASEGEPNLYQHEAGPGSGSYRFIATLAAADVGPGGGVLGSSSATASQPRFHNGRVSPDGLHASFMSVASLSGYDNTDTSSPAPCGEVKGICDTEVFLYDAAAGGGAGSLICASCNPSGGRPAGLNIGSATNPAWEAARVPVLQNALYDGRVLADDGSRLFFESHDSLVSRDTNGRLDVYQWEELDAGGCDQEDATYVPSSGGCIDLISSGKSAADSEFIDASPSGKDVFFTTLASLLPQDYGLIDIYDARVDGGLPPPTPAPPSCLGEACQGSTSPPSDPTPASASFRGAGNPAAKKKQKKRRHAKKHHRKQRRHQHRRTQR